MCYDLETSLSAWVLANVIALYLYNRNKNYDRWNSLFIVTFTSIQLLEAGVWWTMEEGVPNPSNELITKMILLVLLAQPFVQTYMGHKCTQSTFLGYLSFVYLGILLWALFFRLGSAKKGQYSTTIGPKGHLVWNNSDGSFIGGSWVVPSLYFVGLFVPLLFAGSYRGLPLLIVGVMTALYSTFIAGKGEFSSLWCFYAVLYAVVAIFV